MNIICKILACIPLKQVNFRAGCWPLFDLLFPVSRHLWWVPHEGKQNMKLRSTIFAMLAAFLPSTVAAQDVAGGYIGAQFGVVDDKMSNSLVIGYNHELVDDLILGAEARFGRMSFSEPGDVDVKMEMQHIKYKLGVPIGSSPTFAYVLTGANIKSIEVFYPDPDEPEKTIRSFSTHMKPMFGVGVTGIIVDNLLVSLEVIGETYDVQDIEDIPDIEIGTPTIHLTTAWKF